MFEDRSVDGYDTPPPAVGELLDLMGNYLHLDDSGHVWFALAAAVSNRFDGDPLWGMLIGASSGGKTEAIRALDGVAVHVDELTGPALLSWLKVKKPKDQGEQWVPTGILVRMGTRGLITVGDFSTVLAMSDRGGRDKLFALLRRAYDGHVTRDMGNAPDALVWQGRVTMLAGCTTAIDRYTAHEDALGPRWLYYRLRGKPTTIKRDTSRKARTSGPKVEEYREQAAKLAAAIVADAGQLARTVTLSDDFGERIDDAAIVCCYGRAAVPRNGYGRREIEGIPEVEEPPRLTNQLMTLARGLRALGLDEPSTLALCRRTAVDSMPAARRRVLDELAQGDRLAVTEVARRTGLHRHVARYTLEDLAAIGLTDSDDLDDTSDSAALAHYWWLAGDDAALIRQVMTAKRWG
jgi:hypothetical protein